jgi:hypothetical protein
VTLEGRRFGEDDPVHRMVVDRSGHRDRSGHAVVTDLLADPESGRRRADPSVWSSRTRRAKRSTSRRSVERRRSLSSRGRRPWFDFYERPPNP